MGHPESYFRDQTIEELKEKGYEPIGKPALLKSNNPLEALSRQGKTSQMEILIKEANPPPFEPDSWVVTWFKEADVDISKYIGPTSANVRDVYTFKGSLRIRAGGKNNYFIIQPLRKIKDLRKIKEPKSKILKFAKKTP